jgi:hypothetical protein
MSTILIARGRRRSTTLVVSSSMADAIEMVISSKVLTLLLLAIRRLLLLADQTGQKSRYWGRGVIRLGRQLWREIKHSNTLFRMRVFGLVGVVTCREMGVAW